ncbi:hypothetical protein [Leuconostoc mesenteroides]|nr:hypothetical protein [Leuconostoc mesenteroides]
MSDIPWLLILSIIGIAISSFKIGYDVGKDDEGGWQDGSFTTEEQITGEEAPYPP